MRWTLAATCLAFLLSAATHATAAALPELLQAVKRVGPKGEGHAEAAKAWQELARTKPEQLPTLLAGLDDAEPLAANWIRAAAETVAERSLEKNGTLPRQELEAFVLDRDHAPQARRLAYEMLARVDASATDRLIPQMLDDPSLELRRDAVQRVLDVAGATDDKAKQIELYKQALSAGRDLDQIQAAAAKLKELGAPVDLPRHFGFVMRWRVIGPFDNTDKSGFDVAFPPEKTIEPEAAYSGKSGEVKWIEHRTEDEYGAVDLNQTLGKNMGAAGYALTEFTADEAREVEIRLGTPNANKIWLNGELLHEREVYHANTEIDQYRASGTLKPGKNLILVKVLQNEQTDSWAQDWKFQLRVCDATGTAILSSDRQD